MDYVINTAELKASTTPNEASSMHLSADYTGVVLTDMSKYKSVESDAVSAFTQANPDYTLSTKSYTYTSGANGLLKVVALYTFTAQKK